MSFKSHYASEGNQTNQPLSVSAVTGQSPVAVHTDPPGE